MDPNSKFYPEYHTSTTPTAPMNETELNSPGIAATSPVTTKQLMSQKISGEYTYDVITSSPSSSSDGSCNEFVKMEHSDVQRSAGSTDNTLLFGMLQLHNDENDKKKDDRKTFENIMDHGFESEEPYSKILPKAEGFAESALEKVSGVVQAGAGKVMDVASKTVDDATKIKGEVLGDTINLFGDKMKEIAEQAKDMGHETMETIKDTASNKLSGAVHEISNTSEKLRSMGADITHSLDEEYDVRSHTVFQQPTHGVNQIVDDPSQQWGMDWRQYADEAANIDMRHSDLETDVKVAQSTGSNTFGNTIRNEIISAHDQVDSLIANMFASNTSQHHDDSSAEESMFDRSGPLTIPHQIPEDMIQLDCDFDSPKHSGFEVSPRPPTPPKELDDEDVKPTTIDLGQTGGRLFVAGEHPSSILKHSPQVPRFNFKNIDTRHACSDVIIIVVVVVVVASAAVAANATIIVSAEWESVLNEEKDEKFQWSKMSSISKLHWIVPRFSSLSSNLYLSPYSPHLLLSINLATLAVAVAAAAAAAAAAAIAAVAAIVKQRTRTIYRIRCFIILVTHVNPLVTMANSKTDSSSIFDTVFNAIYALISLTIRTTLRFGLTIALIASVVITLHAARQFSRRTLSQRQDVLDVIYWRDPKKSGAILLVTLVVLLILGKFPLIAVFSYVGLSVLGGTLGFRIYKLVEAQVKKIDGRNPYGAYLNQEFHLPKEKIHQHVDALIEHVQFVGNKLRRLFLVESIVDSVKFGVLLWALTYVSYWFSGLSLLMLALLAVFTIPKVYEVYQEPIDRNVSIAKQHVDSVNTIIGEKVPFLKKSTDIHEKSN